MLCKLLLKKIKMTINYTDLDLAHWFTAENERKRVSAEKNLCAVAPLRETHLHRKKIETRIATYLSRPVCCSKVPPSEGFREAAPIFDQCNGTGAIAGTF